MKTIKIYVAGASSEIERIERWCEKLTEIGFVVVCTWPQTVKRVGNGNPPEATHDQRRGWAVQDLDEVAQSNVFWFMLPDADRATIGAWTELGYAFAKCKTIVMSGDNHSVFTGLAHERFAGDQEAFEYLKRQARL